MDPRRSWWLLVSTSVMAACTGFGPDDDGKPTELSTKSELKSLVQFSNENGFAQTLNVNGAIDTTTANPFFASLGTNGRSCGTCHVPDQNWSITPAGVRARFADTGGKDPIFRTNDGANSPNADVSTTSARKLAYSMLLDKGLIRVGIGIPAGAEFALDAVDDPYHYASAADLSLFRRPLPSTNLVFLTATMWDARESSPIADPLRGPNDSHRDLAHQSNDATRGHAQAVGDLSSDVQDRIVAFEIGLFTAQASTKKADSVTDSGALGGATKLATQAYYFGINDVLEGDSLTGADFDKNAFKLFDQWTIATGSKGAARQSIARGQALFNTKKIPLSGVRGVNDVLGDIVGTCTTCHDGPNVGNHSVRLPLDLGLTDASRRTPDMPLYTLCKLESDGTCHADSPRIQTTDPGRALITGKWNDIAKFKGPILRGLSGRAPYFHNGAAATLADVVSFYDTRFGIGLTAQEKADLTAFLGAL